MSNIRAKNPSVSGTTARIAESLAHALDAGGLQSASDVQTKVQSLPAYAQLQAAALALGARPNADRAAVQNICQALGVDEATLRETAASELARALAHAQHLDSPEALQAWVSATTGPAQPPQEIRTPFVTKVAQAISENLAYVTAPLGNAARRRRANKFESQVAKAQGQRQAIIGRDDFDAVALDAAQFEGLGKDARAALDALLHQDAQIPDPDTGKKRALNRGDVVAAHALISKAQEALPWPKFRVLAGPNADLREVLQDPAVAARLLGDNAGNAEDLKRYQEAVSILSLALSASPSKRARKAAEKTRKGQDKFNAQVRALRGKVPQTIRVTSKRASGQLTMQPGHVKELAAATAPLLEGLVGAPVALEDPDTGLGRAINPEDVAIAQKMMALATEALKNHELSINPKTLSLDSIMAMPEVAAAVLQHAKPDDLGAFQKEYHRAVGTLLAQREAYFVQTTWPALTDPQEAKAANLPEGAGPVVVAIRRRPPTEVLQAMETLTHEYFEGITHLWFDDLMSADKHEATRARLETHLDAKGMALLDTLVQYRAEGASQMVAIKNGKRDPAAEGEMKSSLGELTRSTAERSARSAYYNGVSEDTAKEVLKVVGIGMVLGKGLDYGSKLLENPTIEFWKPTVLGGWDDVLGGWVNVKELMDVANKFSDLQVRANRRAGAAVDGVVAVSAGIASSVMLGLPLIDGTSIAEIMLNPEMANAVSAALGAAFYGVASSGATGVLSFLPARHHVEPVLNLVEKGIVSAPTDKEGAPLTGGKLKAWAAKQALRAHLSYTAQMGGALGVGTSAIFMALASPILSLPSALAVNLVLSLGGAFETITTGVVLFGRRSYDERQMKGEFKSATKDL